MYNVWNVFFVCCSYLTIQISFMVTVTKKSTFTNTNTNTSTHPKFEHRRCCFQLSFEYFNAMDSFLSPLQQYHQSPQLCALQKCSQRLKEKLSEISGKKTSNANFPNKYIQWKNYVWKGDQDKNLTKLLEMAVHDSLINKKWIWKISPLNHYTVILSTAYFGLLGGFMFKSSDWE